MKQKHWLSRQQGITLVGLLVGLLVGMIAILGMLTLYRTAVQVTTQSGEYARITGDRSAAMVTAHRVLQNIGFGVSSSGLSDSNVLQECESIELSGGNYQLSNCDAAGNGQYNILVWRYETLELPGAPAEGWCEGLAINASGSLLYLRPQTCASLTPPAWPESDVAVLFAGSPLVGGLFHEFEVSTADCTSFGIENAAGSHSVTLIAHHPTSDDPDDYDPDTDSTFLPFRMQTCLTNLG